MNQENRPLTLSSKASLSDGARLLPVAQLFGMPVQLSLLPTAPNPCAVGLELFEHQSQLIARALTFVESEPVAVSCDVRYFAVCADRRSVLSGWLCNVHQAELHQNPERFWSRLWSGEAKASLRANVQRSEWCLDDPEDCYLTWCKPGRWQRRPDPIHPVAFHRSLETSATPAERIALEASMQAQFVVELAEAVAYVLGALKDGVGPLLVSRPRLSLALARELIDLAKPRGDRALKHVLTALRTEGIPVLDLVARGSTDMSARPVQAALLRGESFPSALASVGVSKSIHRKFLRPDCSLWPESDADQLSGFPLSGVALLQCAPLLKRLPPDMLPRDHNSATEYFLTLQAMLKIGDYVSAEAFSTLLTWCVGRGQAREGHIRFRVLHEWASHFVEAASRLANIQVPLEKAFQMALDIMTRSFQDDVEVRVMQCILDVRNAHTTLAKLRLCMPADGFVELVNPLFSRHPGAPGPRFGWAPYVARPIVNFTQLTQHGDACGLCIGSPDQALEYLLDGAAFYSIELAHSGHVLGTVAFRFAEAGESSCVDLIDLVAENNDAVSEVVDAMGQALCGWFSKNLLPWIVHTEQCAEFHQYVSQPPQGASP